MIHKTNFLLSSLLAFAFVVSPANAQAYIEVKNYGAHPNDGFPDITGIRAAIEALPSYGAVLVFEQGTYDLYPRQTLGQPSLPTDPWYMQKWIFTIGAKSDIVIEGNGATLLCHDFLPDQPIGASYYNLFNINNCTDIEIRNLTVNMSRLPFTIGECKNINWSTNVLSRSFDVLIDFSFLPQSGTLSSMTIHSLINWRNGNPNGRDFFHIQQVPQLAQPDFSATGVGTNYNIKGWSASGTSGPGYDMLTNLANPGDTAKNNYPRLQVGDDVVFIHQFGTYITFFFVDCTRSFMSNVTVHSWPGMAVNMLRDTDVVIDGLMVVPDPQRPWPISILHDAIHVANLSGTLQVNGSYLEGMMDDGFNSLTDLLVPAAAQPDLPGLLDVVPRFPSWTYAAGSVFEFYDTSMKPLGSRALVVASTNHGSPGVHHLDFGSTALPQSIAYVCNLSQHPSSTVLSGTTVKGNRGKGFLIRRNTTVTECLFDRVSGNAISVSPLVGDNFNEGPGGGNIVIENSTFLSCDRGYGLYSLQEGAINIMTAFVSNGAWSSGPHGSISGITLRDLVISDSGGAAVAVRSAESVSITDCFFGSSGDLGYLIKLHPTPPPWGRYAAESLLFFQDSGNITIKDNSVLALSTIINGDRKKPIMYPGYFKSGNVGF